MSVSHDAQVCGPTEQNVSLSCEVIVYPNCLFFFMMLTVFLVLHFAL